MSLNIGIVIGRFMPCHREHVNTLIRPALNQSDTVIIFLGSALERLTFKNPFSVKERINFIKSYLTEDEIKKITFVSLSDHKHDQDWFDEIKNSLKIFKNQNITIFGAKKDDTSWYLDHFPEFKLSLQPLGNVFDATTIREKIYLSILKYIDADLCVDLWDAGEYKHIIPKNAIGLLGDSFYQKIFNSIEDFVSEEVKKYLDDWSKTDVALRMAKEWEYQLKYKFPYKNLKFKPFFHTVDIRIISNDQVLLIKRNGTMGNGLLALPGGFVNHDEKITDAAARELKEELTLSDLDYQNVKKYLNNKTGLVVDTPSRSLLGRVITTLFTINLEEFEKEFSKLNFSPDGGDDASDAKFHSIHSMKHITQKHKFHDDHWYLIQEK